MEGEGLGSDTSLFGVETAEGDTAKNAVSQYTSQLSELLRHHMDEVKAYIRTNHANAHGIRKGSTSYATSGTTYPPSVTSVVNRGDWSMGKVLDVYWTFSDAGDYFLGRILCGLDPNKSGFAIMPPHFIVENNLMEDDDIKKAMLLMYGPVLDKCQDNPANDPTGLLLLALASIIYHSDWLKCVVTKHHGHPFSEIPLLNDPELLSRLKEKVRSIQVVVNDVLFNVFLKSCMSFYMSYILSYILSMYLSSTARLILGINSRYNF